jgi:hypothetical protein
MKKTLYILFVLLSFLVSAQDKKISQLPALPNVAGNEQIPLAISGTNYYLTPNQLKTWFNGAYIPWADTNNFIPITGTRTGYPLTNRIEAIVGGNCAISTKQASGMAMGYGDNLVNLFASSNIYAVSFWDSLQTYFQYYNNITHYGAEFNLAGIDGSGGNGTFARIAAIDYGAGHGTSTNWLLDGIEITGLSGSFKGMMYNQDYSAQFTKYTLVDSNWAATHYAPLIGGGYLPLADTNKFIPITGTRTLYPLSNRIEAVVNGASALSTKQAGGMSVGYGDSLNNLFNSQSIYAISLWDSLQNYHQYYNYVTQYGAEFNLAGIDGSGGNGTFARIAAIDYGAGHGSSTNWMLDGISVAGNSGSFQGMMYDQDYSPHFTKYTLVDSNWVATHYAPLAGGGYLSPTLSNGSLFMGNSSNVATAVTPSLNSAAGTFTVANSGQFTFPDATTSARGFLNSTDWNTFNNKSPAVGSSSITTVGTVTAGVWNSGIVPVVGTTISTATITINTDNYNMYTVTSLSTATTFTVPTGTPKAGQSLLIRIKDNGTAHALTFSTGTNGFRFSSDAPAPTTTTISKTMYLGFRWNEADSKWDNVSPYIDNF